MLVGSPVNARTLCLAILFEGDSTGYEIRKLSTEGEYARCVEASYGAIYPALHKLETEGLVTLRVEHQESRPNRKVYSITESGRREFINSLFDKIDDDVIRSQFALFARFASELPQSLVSQRLQERVEKLNKSIADMDRLASNQKRPADRWMIDHARSCMAFARDHIEAHMGELIAMARPDAAAAAE